MSYKSGHSQCASFGVDNIQQITHLSNSYMNTIIKRERYLFQIKTCKLLELLLTA